MYEQTENKYKMLVDWEEYDVNTNLVKFVSSFSYVCFESDIFGLENLFQRHHEVYKTFLETGVMILLDEYNEPEKYDKIFNDSIISG